MTLTRAQWLAERQLQEAEGFLDICGTCHLDIFGRVVRIWGGTYHAPEEKKGCLVKAFERRKKGRTR